jgi:hypothetical protein
MISVFYLLFVFAVDDKDVRDVPITIIIIIIIMWAG